MTQIASLPLFEAEIESRSNADARGSFVFTDADELPIALTGIEFTMQLRYPRQSHTVPISASTVDNRLQIGGADSNHLIVAIPQEVMERLPPGSYLFDIVAMADDQELVIAYGSWLHVLGITRT